MPPNAASPPLVCIVVVNYNLSEDTVECVRSLEHLHVSDARVEVIVVDNGSSEPDRAKLTAVLENRACLIWNPSNLGYCGGNNVGMRAALAAGADYVVLLNNDTLVDSHFLEALLETARRGPEKTVLTSKILHTQPPNRIWCAGGVIHPGTGVLTNRGYGEDDHGQYETEDTVDFLSGCAVMFPAAALREAGLFWSWLFSYCEDVELSMRLRKLGYSIVYVPGSVVYHKCSRTLGGPVSARKTYFILRNRKMVYFRYPWTPLRRFLWVELKVTLRYTAIGLKHLDFFLVGGVVASTLRSLIALAEGKGRLPGLKNVVLVDYSWRGGISQYTNQLAAALTEQGWNVWVCANRETPFPSNPRFRARPIFRPVRTAIPRTTMGRVLKKIRLGWDYLANARALRRVLKETRPRILHFQTTMQPCFDARLIPMLRPWCERLILTVHNVVPHDRQTRRVVKALRRLYLRFDDLIVHARANRDDLESILGASTSSAGHAGPRAHVIPMPALFHRTQSPDGVQSVKRDEVSGDLGVVERDSARKELGIAPQTQLILFFGQVRPYRGLDVLIEAFGRVAPLRPAAQLAVVGPAEDFAPYERALSEAGLKDRTILRLQFVDDDAAARWFAAADLVALPHREVTQSGVAATAIGAGRAIVASALGGLSELVREGENGRLVPPEDPKALADAILDLLSDPERLSRMGAASARIAREELTWQRAAELTGRVYLELD
jgi:hypothetical protein